MYFIHTSMWNFVFWDVKACIFAECNILLTSRTFKRKRGDNVIYEKIIADIYINYKFDALIIIYS